VISRFYTVWALIERGDMTIRKLVTSIKASPAWTDGSNAIVVLWDENDYSGGPGNPFNTNQVVLLVDTNYGHSGVRSNVYYNHFSLLKSLEAGFELRCLNHACDDDVKVMADIFGSHGDGKKEMLDWQ
jgi:phosphatidylinositol-3-phosphatase